MQLRRILLSLIWLVLCACATPAAGPTPPQGGGPALAVYLVAHDMHTGIAVRRADIPAGLWPESRDFSQAEYLEVGWGNRDYYYGRNQGLGGTLAAMLLPIAPTPRTAILLLMVYLLGFSTAYSTERRPFELHHILNVE